MSSSVCNSLNQETKKLFEESVKNSPSQIEEKVESCRDVINASAPPSPKVMRMIEKISLKMKEESGEFTTEKVEKCRKANRNWLASGSRVRVLREDNMELFDTNKSSAPISPEILEFKEKLKEKLSIEEEMIKAQLSQKA